LRLFQRAKPKLKEVPPMEFAIVVSEGELADSFADELADNFADE